MKRQDSPNRWSCLATSFAMLLDIPVLQVYKEVGHDGSEIWWPSLPKPYCYRSFHIQEMIHICFNRGIAITEFQPQPCSQGSGLVVSHLVHVPDIWPIMRNKKGVITGETLQGARHAVVWTGKRILDPGGRITKRDEMVLENLWLASEIKKTKSKPS